MCDLTITNILGREVMDSRGNPTVEVDVYLAGGAMGRAAVPSGASTGMFEAWELRDGDDTRFNGNGVLSAVGHVNDEIAEALIGHDAIDQVGIDRMMKLLDGTPNKAKLGANAILGVSLAVAKASALQLGMPLYRYLGGCNAKVLPMPMMNILNGGAHSDAPIDFQELMIVPLGARSFKQAVVYGASVFHSLKKVLKDKGLSTAVGDEGGFAPHLSSIEEALTCMSQAVENVGLELGSDIAFALDVASSEFYDEKEDVYIFKKSDGRRLSAGELVEYYASLQRKFPIISIEDGCAESDWKGWEILTQALGKTTQLVGDDLFVTNVEFLKKGIQEEVANAILVKVNQIGSLTETLDAVQMAQHHSYRAVISHRSGETEDSTIADIAVGMNAGQIKTGSMSRSDRMAKYNQLIRIEEELGDDAVFYSNLKQ